jgi:predicted nucleotidyltransferase
MSLPLDIKTIRENLQHLYKKREEEGELVRLKTKKEVKQLLQEFFIKHPDCEVWLFGSLIQPFSFSFGSDVDIAVKGFQGSRLDLYSDLEAFMPLPFDLVILERSAISEEIMLRGEKIV